MKRLRPFFSYYGSKWRIAPNYPFPKYDNIIEPFAGSACYSLCYPDKKIQLYDLYEPIVGAWDFLINCSNDDILNIPSMFKNVNELNISQEAKWLVGFNINPASQMPKKTFSKWVRENNSGNNAQIWGDKKKRLIINQKQYIKHWKVNLLDYKNIDNIESTWFIDPPYQGKAGGLYVKSDINYKELEDWISNRKGQYIACEMLGCRWGLFEPFIDARVNPSKLGSKKIKEMIWTGFN